MVFIRRVGLLTIILLTLGVAVVVAIKPAFADDVLCVLYTGEGQGKCIPPLNGKLCYGAQPVWNNTLGCDKGLTCCSKKVPVVSACTTAGGACLNTGCPAIDFEKVSAGCPSKQTCCKPVKKQKLTCVQWGGKVCAPACIDGWVPAAEVGVPTDCVGYASYCCKPLGSGAGTCKGKENAGTCLAPSNCYGDEMHSIGPKADCPTGAICCVENTPSANAVKTTAAAATAKASGVKAPPSGVMTRLWLPDCFKDGNCDVNSIVATGVYFAQFLMGLSGALFFGIFIYGGTLYLVSFGKKSYVEKGKKTITGAALGLVIVMGAYTFVTYLSDTLTGGSKVTGGAAVGSAGSGKPAAGADAKCAALGIGWSCVEFNEKEPAKNAAAQGYETKAGYCPTLGNKFLCAKQKS